MGDNNASSDSENHQVFDVPTINSGSRLFNDRPKGTVWTVIAHIITAGIGSGVLSSAWATAQLGWIVGPIVMFLFSFITYYTSTLLTHCYSVGDNGMRRYTYMDAVQYNLGGFKARICGLVQYLSLFGVAIGYTIAASISMMAINRADCFHHHGGKGKCQVNSNPYIIAFGIVEIISSLIPGLNQLWWLSIVSAVMSFTYSSIGLGLVIAKLAVNGKSKVSPTGISIGTVTESQKIWRSFQALGDLAFAYSYPIILIEIQGTIKTPPSEAETMKKASLISVLVTTVFCKLCGTLGYLAFGDLAPRNLFTDFGFYEPFWLLDIANAAIVIHLVGAYQVYCQPLFAFVEKTAAERFPDSEFITKDIKVPIPGSRPYRLNLFRLVWRTIFVIITTVMSMLLPFFNDMVGLLGALGFWPLTVYLPVEMYIAQKQIPRWSTRGICLRILSIASLIVTIAALAGSIAGIVLDIKSYKPFMINY